MNYEAESTVDRIYVTQPSMPPLEEFIPYLEEIWRSKCLTNGGPFHQQLERAVGEYLGVQNVALCGNGTVALMTALRALDIRGEVITTPFSFVATAHSLLWNGIRPVFVDIDPHTFNLNPEAIEAAITSETTAILPVHCYGNPCDVERIGAIAKTHGLKVLYDAAHAFGVKMRTESILKAGDFSVLSFHATKVYNTLEGGAIVCPDAKAKACVDQLKNFGFVDEVTVAATGINGKMNEMQAAFGLLQLKHLDKSTMQRALIDQRYREGLEGVVGIQCMPIPEGVSPNYGYFPVLVQPEHPLSRDQVFQRLRSRGIFARRYFYPLISDFPMYRDIPSADPTNLPCARRLAERVLCLPIYSQLPPLAVDAICHIIRSV